MFKLRTKKDKLRFEDSVYVALCNLQSEGLIENTAVSWKKLLPKEDREQLLKVKKIKTK